MAVATGGDEKYSEGWHEVTIRTAEMKTWNDNNYMELTFEDYPDNLNARIYEAVNKTTGEEFKVSNLFINFLLFWYIFCSYHKCSRSHISVWVNL